MVGRVVRGVGRNQLTKTSRLSELRRRRFRRIYRRHLEATVSYRPGVNDIVATREGSAW